MFKDLILENELREEINRMITEELTVNKEVLDSCKKVEDYIIENIPKLRALDFADGGGKRTFDFSMKVFNEELKVNFSVTNFNFRDRQYFKKYNDKYTIDLESKSAYNFIVKRPIALCYINYLSIGFNPFPKFYEDIYHELNHLYQQHMEKHTYSDSDRYSYIPNSIYSENEIEHDSAEIVYLSTPYEQDSYASSVYNYVRHQMQYDNNLDKLLKETDAYNKIYRLKELFNKIKKNKSLYSNEILKKYGFRRWDRFDKHIRNSIDRFEKKFAMCVKKCKNDFLIYDTHTWCEGINRNILYYI